MFDDSRANTMLWLLGISLLSNVMVLKPNVKLLHLHLQLRTTSSWSDFWTESCVWPGCRITQNASAPTKIQYISTVGVIRNLSKHARDQRSERRKVLCPALIKFLVGETHGNHAPLPQISWYCTLWLGRKRKWFWTNLFFLQSIPACALSMRLAYCLVDQQLNWAKYH